MEFIWYPKCSTCQKIKNYLVENNISLELRDIKENPPTIEELTKWYQNNDYDIKKFFNTSGLIYKELNLKDKLITMSLEDKIKILSTNGMLIKRPILIINNKIIIGSNLKDYEVLNEK